MSTQERTIVCFSTKGKRRAEIKTNVTTWGELKPLIKREGYDLDKLLATENINRHDLANEGAILPEGDFTIFLRPTKTKSGGKDYSSMSFKELRAELSDDDKSSISKMFDKNYTRCSSNELREYLQKTGGTPSSAPAPIKEDKPKKEKKSNVGDVVSSIKKNKEGDSSDGREKIVELLTDVIKKANVALQMIKNIVEESEEQVDLEAQAKAEEEAKAKAEAERIAQEKAEKERLEREKKERLAKEAEDLMAGF